MMLIVAATSLAVAQNPDQRTSIEFKWHQEFNRYDNEDFHLTGKSSPFVIGAKMVIPKSEILSVILAGGYGQHKEKYYLSGDIINEDGRSWTSAFFEVGFKLYIGIKK